jgi:peptide/nickel transport system substrate-binding protein
MFATAAAAALWAPAAMAERGADGQLNILYWQAVSILNPYLSGGTKDIESASLVIEPLARYDQDGKIVPYLVEDVPTLANGGIAADLLSITWKIKPGIKWSDGSDFTAEDVRFTWQYCTAEGGGCQQASNFQGVKDVEVVDPLTVRVHFEQPTPHPYGPFVGATSPIIQKAQFANCLGAAAPTCTDANFGPHGTGPFKVKEFKANDVVVFELNPNYRDPAKPAFATVVFKGGGDAPSAAKAVLETGEFDYAWNMQVPPDVLAQMLAAGKGRIINAFGTQVERLHTNLSNPDPALGEKRSTLEGGPHPFLTDPNVVKALSLAIDRNVIAEKGYGNAGQPTCNVVPAPANYVSTANDWCLTQDVAAANKLLDDAGWTMGSDGVRVKDGKRLSVLFQTSTNAVRQGTQAIIKQQWAAIGVETELRNIDAAVYFGGDPASPDTIEKFYADFEMFTNNFDGTDAQTYMANWRCKEIPSPATNWAGANQSRFCSPEYDALVEKLTGTADPAERSAIVRQLNDMLIQGGVMIPLVHRGRVSAVSNRIAGVIMNPWDSELWNIADWSVAK